jgi:hypothetical protein
LASNPEYSKTYSSSGLNFSPSKSAQGLTPRWDGFDLEKSHIKTRVLFGLHPDPIRETVTIPRPPAEEYEE